MSAPPHRIRVDFSIRNSTLTEVCQSLPAERWTVSILEDVPGDIDRMWLDARIREIRHLLPCILAEMGRNPEKLMEGFSGSLEHQLFDFQKRFRRDVLFAPRYWSFQEFSLLYDGDIVADIQKYGVDVWAGMQLANTSPYMTIRLKTLQEGSAALLESLEAP